MFQNIAKDFDESQNEEVENKKKRNIKEVLQKNFTKKQVLLYVVCLMVSFVGIGEAKELAPFGIAILVAALSNCIPVGIITILIGIGTYVSLGTQGLLNFILTTLLIIVSMLIIPAKYEEEGNEKRRLGFRVCVCTLVVEFAALFFKEILVYDVLTVIMRAIAVYIFYKVFVNALPVVTSIGEKKAYSIEEVMGASLLAAIAASSLGVFTIFGFSVRNILCILLVLVMGWKNGILVGGTAGIVIGTVIGIVGKGEPILLASYAVSGMVAGILNKFGKIGVVVGFLLGNVVLTYVANGGQASIVMWQEILIASLGLLAVPKNIKIDIQKDLDTKLLPIAKENGLEENKETIYRLNSMSDSILNIANTYKEVAATTVEKEDIEKQEEKNFMIFEREFTASLEGIEENILFDELYAPQDDILKDIFKNLLGQEKITVEQLKQILEEHHCYFVLTAEVEEDFRQIVNLLNESYRICKINFIWKRKLEENKQVVSNQLEEVSKAIGKLAKEIEEKEEVETEEKQLQEKQKIEIKNLLEQKSIYIKEIQIQEEENGKKKVLLYTATCENVEEPTCNIKKMERILSKVLEEEMVIQKEECAIRLGKDTCKFYFVSQDKLRLQVGIAKATKVGSSISGDTSLQTKLEDGKQLLAISDGMGSGKEARKNSKMAIAMLEKLLSSGFEKDTSLKLINSTLQLQAQEGEDMYVTLDMLVLDLYAKNIEFIKNGACPTFVKSTSSVTNKAEVQILKAVGLPSGILEDIDLVVYDKDIQENDIIVMCSDGIIESTHEYTNKELWVKFLLEEMETQDAQKIADIILQEAIDNDFGKQKDDMTVMVAKVIKR